MSRLFHFALVGSFSVFIFAFACHSFCLSVHTRLAGAFELKKLAFFSFEPFRREKGKHLFKTINDVASFSFHCLRNVNEFTLLLLSYIYFPSLERSVVLHALSLVFIISLWHKQIKQHSTSTAFTFWRLKFLWKNRQECDLCFRFLM